MKEVGGESLSLERNQFIAMKCLFHRQPNMKSDIEQFIILHPAFTIVTSCKDYTVLYCHFACKRRGLEKERVDMSKTS